MMQNDGVEQIRDSINRFEELMKENKEHLYFLRREANHSFIIALYTIWESRIKELIFTTLKKYVDIISDNSFIQSYVKSAVEGNRYVKDIFVYSFVENKFEITKEILCNTNNLDYSTLKKLLKRLFPNMEETYLAPWWEAQKIKNIISELEKQGVEKEEIGESVSIEGYLKTIVNRRNTLSHNFDVDIIFNKDQKETLLLFIESLLETIDRVIDSLVVFKYIKKGSIKNKIPITKVYKCNTKEENAIVEIECTNCASGKIDNKRLYLEYVEKKNYYYEEVRIESIRNENGNTCFVIPKNGRRTISINSNTKIKKRKSYQLVELSDYKRDSQDKYEIVVRD